MPPKKSRLEVGFINGEPDRAFFDEAHRILLEPYRDEADDPVAIADRRRLMEFIALAIEYLRGLGAGDRLVDKLMVYYAALRDLDRGVQSPIFMARNLSHAAPLSSEIWRLRAMLAVAMDYLMRAGERSEDAARIVARRLGVKLLLSGNAGDEAYKSVKKWRGNLRRGEVPDEMAQMVWKASREELAGIDGPQGFRVEATRLMKRARDELVR